MPTKLKVHGEVLSTNNLMWKENVFNTYFWSSYEHKNRTLFSSSLVSLLLLLLCFSFFIVLVVAIQHQFSLGSTVQVIGQFNLGFIIGKLDQDLFIVDQVMPLLLS